MKEAAGTRAGNDSPEPFGKTTEEEDEEGGEEDGAPTYKKQLVPLLR